MQVANYLIDPSAFDWQNLLATWRWRLPSTFTVWIMNRFGDLFLKTADGKIHLLRLDDGSLECLADSKDQFCSKIDVAETANEWLMIPLIERLVAVGKILEARECYAFVKLPVIGGDYAVENIEVREVEFQYMTLGSVFDQMKDLPDGTAVEFKFRDEEGG